MKCSTLSAMATPGVLTPSPHQSKFHIVLVEPAESLNVGSVVRAMRNLGFGSLHLVRPVNFDPKRAAITACWGEDLIKEIKIHDSLEEVLKEVKDVVGFSTREGRNRSSHMVMNDWLANEIPTPPVDTAILFGPEDNGLREEHTEQCRCLVRIPSVKNCPAFNLAQSVLLVLYDLSKRTWDGALTQKIRHLPDWNQFFQLDRIIDDVLVQCSYYRSGTPGPIPALVKGMFRRMNPDEREMRVLLGLFARVNKALKGEIPTVDPEEELLEP